MIRWLFFGLILVHGLIHFLGFAKAFQLAPLPQLTHAIEKTMGVVWLGAGLLMMLAALLYLTAPRLWWGVGFIAVVLSQIVIAGSWTDAKFGTLANVLVMALVVHGFAAHGPVGLRATWERDVRSRRARARATTQAQRLAGSEPSVPRERIADADLDALPEPVQRYLRLNGAVGRPHVREFSARWRGRIRAAPGDPWMEFVAGQHNFPSHEPARFFLMHARRNGLPVDVLHEFEGDAASMRVRLLSIFPLATQRGHELHQAETVTVLNDLCLLAPATLLNQAIRWESIDAHSARVSFAAGRHTASAQLVFNDAGELIDFVSDDRLIASRDGKHFERRRWSTPWREYRSFGPWRIGTRGEGRWHGDDGEFVYIELELLDLKINGGG